MNQPRLIPNPAMSGPPVRQEENFSRDMGFLRRHREWGFGVPAQDIDFLEYNTDAKAVCIVEYKFKHDIKDSQPNFNKANTKALIDLGNRAGLPVFCVFYNSNRRWFKVHPLTDIANQTKPPLDIVSEYKFVDFLWYLRGESIPDDIAFKLWGF